MPRTLAPLAASLAAAIVLAACSQPADEAAPTPPPAAPTVTSPAPAVTVTETVAAPSPSAPPAASPSAADDAEEGGCPSNGQPAPEPASGELVGDFDGDGASDRVVLADGVLTFATASGFVAGLQLGEPGTRALAVADPQEDGQTYVFLAVDTTPPESYPQFDVRLASLIDCEPTIVTDVDGEPYVIEYTADESGGLGFGCTDADDDGDRELVGLVQSFTEESHTFERTVIELAGGVASNGATDSGEIPEGSNAPLASCGNQVFELG